MSQLSLTLRIARRSALRSKARSALIVAMIALPIAGLTAVALVGTSMTPTAAETITTKLGQTKALVQVAGTSGDGITQVPTRPSEYEFSSFGDSTGFEFASSGELFDGLGYQVIATYPTTVGATTATGFATFDAVEGRVWDASFAGRYDLVAGRGPRADSEILVSPATLSRLGLAIGDSVELRNASMPSAVIVGTLDDQSVPDSAQVFFGRTGAFSPLDAADRDQNTTYFIPNDEVDWSQVKELNSRGGIVLSRSVLLDPPAPAPDIPLPRDPDGPIALFAIAGILGVFTAFEVVLLAGAAFTVTARQQQRTLATIASVGATASTLRRVVTASGLVLGAIGGVAGIAVGVGAGAAFMQLTADGSNRQYYGFHVPWLLLVAIAVFAILVGWVSALAPARVAAKLDVVAALRGSRRPPEATVRRPVVGLVFLIAGVGLTLIGGVLMSLNVTAEESALATDGTLNWLPPATLATGPVLALIGLIGCGPLVLRVIARLMRRAPIGARLSSRDAARNPGRSVPAIAVTMTTVFIAVVAMNLISSVETWGSQNWSYRAPVGVIEVTLDNSYNYTGIDLPSQSYDVGTIETAVRSSVDVDRLAVLSSVPEPRQLQSGETDVETGGSYPFVAIPQANACDADDPDLTSWQCNMNFVEPGSSGIRDRITVGDATGLEMILGRAPSAAALEALADGGVISFYPHPVSNDAITIDWWSSEQIVAGDHYTRASDPERSTSVDAVVELPVHPVYFGVYMSPQTAKALELTTERTLMLATTATPPTAAQEDALMFALEHAKPGLSAYESPAIISRGPEPTAQAWAWGLLALSALVALAAAGVAIGLARFDGRRDDATLASLGAGRIVRRSFAFWQALVLVGTGAVLGAGLGIIPSIAMSQNAITPFAPPWVQIALIVTALPLVIAAGSWLTSSRAPWTMRVAGE